MIENVVPAPVVTHAAPAPVFEYVAPVPVIEYIAPAPAVICAVPSPQFLLVSTTTTVTADVNLDITGLVKPAIFQYCCGGFCATGRWFTSSL